MRQVSTVTLLAAATLSLAALWLFWPSSREDVRSAKVPPVGSVVERNAVSPTGVDIRPIRRSIEPANRTSGTLIAQYNALLARLPVDDAEMRQSMLVDFARTLSSVELELMLSQIERFPAGEVRDGLREALLEQLAHVEPIAAMAFVEGMLNSDMRERDRRMVAEIWTRVDALAALEWLLVHKAEALLVDLAPMLVSQLETDHPYVAAEFISALPAGSVREAAMGRLMSRWGSADFDTALGWVRQQESGVIKEQALIHLSHRWAEVDPHGAVEYAATLSSGGSRLLTVLASQWATRDPQAAAEWAVQMRPGDARVRVLASLTAQWAQQDPIEAARFAATLADGEALGEIVVSAISGWAQQDPRGAANWAMLFPSGPLQERAFTQVLFAWGRRDTVSSAEWLMSLPDGAARDAAFSSFSGAIVEKHPAFALKFAEGIASETLRAERIETVGRQWLAADYESAANALARSSISVDTLTRLLREQTAMSSAAGPSSR